MSHAKKPTYLDPRRGNTSKVPSAEHTGRALVEAWKYLTQWQRAGSMFSYVGPPDVTASLNPQADGGATKLVADFHFVFSSPDRTDGAARQFEIMLRHWRLNWTDLGLVSAPRAEWYAPFDAVAPQLFNVGMAQSAGPTSTYGDALNAAPVKLSGLAVPPHGGVPYHCMLRLVNVMPGAVSIREQPDSLLSDAQAIFSPDHFALLGEIEGRDDLDALPSLGQLMQHVDGSETAETIERLTRRNLIAWGHGVGIWTQYADAAATNLFNESTFKAKPRSLRPGAGNVVACTPAFVIACSAGTKIQFASAVTADFWTWTAPAPIATPTLIAGVGELNVAVDGDAISVGYQFDAEGQELLVPSVYLFEGPPTVA